VATDIIQIVDEAVVAILDTHADIIAITGQPSENIVSWATIADDPRPKVPKLAYLFVVAPELAADGETWEVQIQLTADAPKDAQRNELLGVCARVLDQPAFLALTPAVDAFAIRRIRRAFNLDVTLRVAA
jgi:hypothetical protein